MRVSRSSSASRSRALKARRGRRGQPREAQKIKEAALLGHEEQQRWRFDLSDRTDGIVCEYGFERSGVVGVDPVGQPALGVGEELRVAVGAVGSDQAVVGFEVGRVALQGGVIDAALQIDEAPLYPVEGVVREGTGAEVGDLSRRQGGTGGQKQENEEGFHGMDSAEQRVDPVPRWGGCPARRKARLVIALARGGRAVRWSCGRSESSRVGGSRSGLC